MAAPYYRASSFESSRSIDSHTPRARSNSQPFNPSYPYDFFVRPSAHLEPETKTDVETPTSPTRSGFWSSLSRASSPSKDLKLSSFFERSRRTARQIARHLPQDRISPRASTPPVASPPTSPTSSAFFVSRPSSPRKASESERRSHSSLAYLSRPSLAVSSQWEEDCESAFMMVSDTRPTLRGLPSANRGSSSISKILADTVAKASPATAYSSSKSKPASSADSDGRHFVNTETPNKPTSGKHEDGSIRLKSGALPKDESWSSSLSGASGFTGPSSIFDSPIRSRKVNKPSAAGASGLPRLSISEESIALPSEFGVSDGHAGVNWSTRGHAGRASSDLERLDEQRAPLHLLSAAGPGNIGSNWAMFSGVVAAGSTSSGSGGTASVRNSLEQTRRARRASLHPSPALPPTNADSTGRTAQGDSAPARRPSKGVQKKTKMLSRGGGKGWAWFRRDTVHKPRYHPHDAKDVPYLLPYHRELLDGEIVETLALREKTDMIPWNKSSALSISPKKVLDIGCGLSAFWITEAAKTWTSARFVGLDIAPVLLPLERFDPFLSSRLSFVQANFLEKWPFEDGEFDFVRLVNLGMGVPETSWNHLYDEAARVVKATGLVQCIEHNAPAYPDTADRKVVKVGKLYNYREAAESVAALGSVEPLADSADAVVAESAKRLSGTVTRHYEGHLISPFPRSMFPAAFVLSFKNVADGGPMTILGCTACPGGVDQTSSEAKEDIARRVLEASAVQGHFAQTYSPYCLAGRTAETEEEGGGNTREVEEDYLAVRDFLGAVRHRVGMASLLEEAFGWTCRADEIMEEQLAVQVDALAAEEASARTEKEKTGSELSEMRLTELGRALREVRLDLQATRRRLGRTGEWKDPLSTRRFTYEVMMKAGKKL